MTDVNVWLALAFDRHEHHRAALDWFSSLEAGQAAFCRVTQMGLLRLLTNRGVMRDDILSVDAAWSAYRRLREDWRVSFAAEPTGCEQDWIGLMTEAPGRRSWTDAYLAAFASGHAYTMVSFDRGYRRWPALRLRLLE